MKRYHLQYGSFFRNSSGSWTELSRWRRGLERPSTVGNVFVLQWILNLNSKRKYFVYIWDINFTHLLRLIEPITSFQSKGMFSINQMQSIYHWETFLTKFEYSSIRDSILTIILMSGLLKLSRKEWRATASDSKSTVISHSQSKYFFIDQVISEPAMNCLHHLGKIILSVSFDEMFNHVVQSNIVFLMYSVVSI